MTDTTDTVTPRVCDAETVDDYRDEIMWADDDYVYMFAPTRVLNQAILAMAADNTELLAEYVREVRGE